MLVVSEQKERPEDEGGEFRFISGCACGETHMQKCNCGLQRLT
jgi:hypothetical protein